MHAAIQQDQALLSRGMIAVLLAQFLSALADNALLFAAIAMLMSNNAPSWQIPMLQEFFVVAFILVAPFVGPFADGLPKGKVMLIANLLKFIGASTMLAGLNPLISYGLVGLGAAAYSPAKYGILSELVSEKNLVKANGMMEGSTIVAILLGAVLGGMLADYSVNAALMFICWTYLVAALANTFIPKLSAFKVKESYALIPILKDFIHALKTLFGNKDARFSLLGTSVFWGTGSTLRLLMIAWVPAALQIKDLSMPANLSGAVAIGIAVGAGLAAKMVGLNNVNRILPVGISIGLLIMAFAQVNTLYMAITLLIIIGAAGGFYVVPLNALLQERGHETVGAGNAVAVQNFFENCTMLLLVGIYVGLEKSGLPIITIATVFGAVIFVCIGLIAVLRYRKS